MMITTYGAPAHLRRVRPVQDARDLAELLYRHLVRDTRENGEAFYHLSDDAPEWCTDVVRAAHGDMLPDDFKYETVHAIAGSLCDNDPDTWEDDVRHDIVDGLVDVYTANLTAWLASHIDRVAYLDEASQDGGESGASNVLMRAQYAEIDEIYGLLVTALRDQWDEIEIEKAGA